MSDQCFDTKLLTYSGTSQASRIMPALAGTYASVDERTTADLILFAKKYGAYLNYYELTNSITGTWENLMARDVSVLIADIADWPTRDYARFVEYLNDKITSAPSVAEMKKYFKLNFDFIFSLASNLDKSLNRLPVDLSFSKFLSVAISSNLALPLNVLNDHYTSFKTTLIDETSTFADSSMPVADVVLSQNFDLVKLSLPWQSPASAPITLTGNVKNDINHIITHNLFTAPLQGFINGVINLVAKATSYLQETLVQYPTHSPHYALYLTFLRLFRFAQDQLNQYTGRHLDFYYKDVLRLTNRPAEPDFVHLVFELQKNIDAHLLTKGTAFKAGKDDKKNDLFYKLTNDVVIQKAVVQTLKSLYLQKSGSGEVLYASPVADSEDGKGGKLLSVDKSWFAFGNPEKVSTAALGFAIASNILFLNEGERVVTLTFQCNSLTGVLPADLTGIFDIQFTAKKNWYTADNYTASKNGNAFSLSVTLPGDAPAIVPYSQKIHTGNFPEALPMVQLLLKSYTSYKKIKALKILAISVQVTATVKNLVLQNDDGKINSAKPFKPFGEFADNGASLVIGSKEVFQKPLTELAVNIDWQTSPVNTKAKVLALARGKWGGSFGSDFYADVSQIVIHNNVVSASTPQISADPSLIFLFPEIIGFYFNSITIPGLHSIPVSLADFTANEDYSVTSTDGFIKLQLTTDDYSLAKYLSRIPAPAVTVNYDDADPTKVKSFTSSNAAPAPPAPPVASSITLSYTANETISPAQNSFFYHIEPFGFRQMDSALTADAITLLPVFNLDDGKANDNGGELWIGLNNTLAGQTLSMLFQVADGSSNPLKNMTQVDWYYLSNNNWLKFDHLLVSDQTNNLTRSGLVLINIPADATSSNVRADAGLIWVKSVVDHDPDAVCKLIAVKANGARATFEQDPAKKIEFTKPLASGIISKPAVSDAALKKTEQPYPSFGGHIRETDTGFYIRVSERLRHKHRAIAQWDYERLVLQYFPQIHKVKCLNHTGFLEDKKTNSQKYSELLPGHVMVITIPDLTNIATADQLHPYTSIGLLTEIQQYLQAYTSPFVKLHVCNPQFEEVQFDFKVTFYPNYDVDFYTKFLKDEIQQFLTPWANQSGKDIEFGGKIEKSVVLNFVEERSYVDFVTCFKMNQIIHREGSVISEALYDIEEAVASTARSILVSYSNEDLKQTHIINSPAKCDCNG